MRRLLPLMPFLLLGCGSSQSPEEKAAANYPQPKMMSEEEGRKLMEGDRAARQGLATGQPQSK